VKECVVCGRCLDDAAEACPADGAVPQAGLPGGLLLDGKYRLEQRLGAGGMGVVFRARHLGLGRDVAVKLIRSASAPGPAYLARFRTEAAALGRLEHPGIVNVSDFGVDPREQGTPYLVMEFLEGLSLEEHCRTVGPLPLEAALPLLEAMAEAVDFAHSRGVLHRDLKPANVLLVPDGTGTLQVKLMDFGLARLGESSRGTPSLPSSDPARLARREREAARTLTVASSAGGEDSTLGLDDLLGTPLEAPLASGTTRPGQLLGTPAFMAPERFSTGESSPAADVYALGVTAFFLLTGRTPFHGSLSAVARGHLSESPPPPSQLRAGIPEEVDRVLLRALAKDPSRRPPSARAFVGDLRSVVAAEALRHWRGREVPRRLAAGLGIGILLTALSPLVGALSPVAGLERRAIDVRFGLAPPRALDPRLLIVTLDDASLAGETRGLPEMGGSVATGLERAFGAGAKAVAIDLLAPASWSRSGEFVRFVTVHRKRLTLAAHATPEGTVGPEAVQGLATTALGEEAAGLFGLVNLKEDEDGVVRRARVSFPTQDGGRLESFAGAAVRSLTGQRPPDPPSPPSWLGLAAEGTFHLDLSASPTARSIVSWQDLPGLLDGHPDALAGKLVLLGARLAGSGDDALRVPVGSGTAPGVVIQALAMDTILSGFPVREPRGPLVAGAVAVSVGMVAFAALFGASRVPPLAGTAAVVAAYLGTAVLAFRTGRWLVPVVTPVVLWLAGAALAMGLRAALPPRPLTAGKGRKR
jgi:serine/threonine protein kinase/CHASE2 domain-containing sensor protein